MMKVCSVCHQILWFMMPCPACVSALRCPPEDHMDTVAVADILCPGEDEWKKLWTEILMDSTVPCSEIIDKWVDQLMKTDLKVDNLGPSKSSGHASETSMPETAIVAKTS